FRSQLARHFSTVGGAFSRPCSQQVQITLFMLSAGPQCHAWQESSWPPIATANAPLRRIDQACRPLANEPFVVLAQLHERMLTKPSLDAIEQTGERRLVLAGLPDGSPFQELAAVHIE